LRPWRCARRGGAASVELSTGRGESWLLERDGIAAALDPRWRLGKS
jgi:hypothetical protein